MSAHKAEDVNVPAGSKEALQKPLVSNAVPMSPQPPPGERQKRERKVGRSASISCSCDKHERYTTGERRAPEEVGHLLHHQLRWERALLCICSGCSRSLTRAVQERPCTCMSILPRQAHQCKLHLPTDLAAQGQRWQARLGKGQVTGGHTGFVAFAGSGDWRPTFVFGRGGEEHINQCGLELCSFEKVCVSRVVRRLCWLFQGGGRDCGRSSHGPRALGRFPQLGHAKEAVRRADHTHTHCLHVQIVYKGPSKRPGKCDGDPIGCPATRVGPPTCCSRESSCRESSRQHLFTGEAMGFVCVVAPCSDHVAKRHGTSAVQLNQCVYGADTVKTNGDCFQCTMDAERSKALRSSTASLPHSRRPHWKGLRTACGGHGVAHYLSGRISCWALLGVGVRLEGSACIADRRVPDIRRPRRSSKPATYNIVLVRLDLYGGGTIKHNVMKENIAETSAQKRERENLAAQSLDHRPSGELGQPRRQG